MAKRTSRHLFRCGRLTLMCIYIAFTFFLICYFNYFGFDFMTLKLQRTISKIRSKNEYQNAFSNCVSILSRSKLHYRTTFPKFLSEWRIQNAFPNFVSKMRSRISFPKCVPEFLFQNAFVNYVIKISSQSNSRIAFQQEPIMRVPKCVPEFRSQNELELEIFKNSFALFKAPF